MGNKLFSKASANKRPTTADTADEDEGFFGPGPRYASKHLLKEIPEGPFVALTGFYQSGRSTFLNQTAREDVKESDLSSFTQLVQQQCAQNLISIMSMFRQKWKQAPDYARPNRPYYPYVATEQEVLEADKKMQKAQRLAKKYTRKFGDIDATFPQWLDTYNKPKSYVTDTLKKMVENLAPLKAVVTSKSGRKVVASTDSYYYRDGSMGYFLDNAERIASAGFVPTPADIARTHTSTASVQDPASGLLMKEVNMQMNIGGRGSVRRHWLHTFGQANAIVHFVDLASFFRSSEENGYNWVDDGNGQGHSEKGESALDEAIKAIAALSNAQMQPGAKFVVVLTNTDYVEYIIKNDPTGTFQIKDHQNGFGDQFENSVAGLIEYASKQIMSIDEGKNKVHAIIAGSMLESKTADKINAAIAEVLEGVTDEKLSSKKAKEMAKDAPKVSDVVTPDTVASSATAKKGVAVA